MKAKSIISLAIVATLLTSCGIAPIQESTMSEITETIAASFEVQLDYVTSDPEIEEDKGTTKKVTFYRDGNPVKAKIYLPEGEGPYKTIIIVGGLYASVGIYSNKAQVFTENGYAVVEIRPTNNKMPQPYAEPEYNGDFVYDQTLDLCAVMDELEAFDELDSLNVYLFGHSMGGLVTIYAGVLKQDEIKGIILVEPSFQYPEKLSYENDQKLPDDFYTFLSGCQLPVVIFQGTGDRPDIKDFPNFYDKAIEAIPDSELLIIEGADHQMSGEYGTQMASEAVSVMESWNN